MRPDNREMRAPYERFQDVWDHPVASHMRLAVAQAAKKGVLYSTGQQVSSFVITFWPCNFVKNELTSWRVEYFPRKDLQRLREYISQESISKAIAKLKHSLIFSSL